MIMRLVTISNASVLDKSMSALAVDTRYCTEGSRRRGGEKRGKDYRMIWQTTTFCYFGCLAKALAAEAGNRSDMIAV